MIELIRRYHPNNTQGLRSTKKWLLYVSQVNKAILKDLNIKLSHLPSASYFNSKRSLLARQWYGSYSELKRSTAEFTPLIVQCNEE